MALGSSRFAPLLALFVPPADGAWLASIGLLVMAGL
jgi:hypothetical protein